MRTLKDIKVKKIELNLLNKIIRTISKVKEPSNRWYLGLNNQEKLAYFKGYSDTRELILLILKKYKKCQTN